MPQPNYRRQGYHDEIPPWRRSTTLRGKYVGVELEVAHDNGYEHLLSLLPLPRGGGAKPITEMDGSLNSETSCEIVFPPYKYRDAKKANTFLGTAMKALKDGGAEPDEEGGMHVNINTNGWGRDKIGAFMGLINALPVRWVERVGGRELNEYCARMMFANLKCYNEGATDHNMVDWHNGRLECRFPKATVDHVKFINILTFLELVERAAGDRKFRGLLAKAIRENTYQPTTYRYRWAGDYEEVPMKYEEGDDLWDFETQFEDKLEQEVGKIFMDHINARTVTEDIKTVQGVMLNGYR